MKTYHYKDCIVNSITMEYRNMKLFQKLHAEGKNPYALTKEEEFDNYTIDMNDWNLILELLETAVYDESQWDKEKNPDGDRRKILPHDFTLFINCSNGAKTVVDFWIGKISNRTIRINSKWHDVNASKRIEFDSMISKYVESQEH